MNVLLPITVTDAMLVSSSVDESDASAWASGTTYDVGDLVVKGHRVWESAAPANTNHDPQTAGADWWIDTGPTNRWALFDDKPSTATSASGSITLTLAPGVWITDLALVSFVGAQARVLVLDADGTTILFDQTKALPGISDVSFHAWFFRDRLVVDGDLVFSGLPKRLGAQITVTLTGTGTVSVGVLAVGTSYQIGNTLAGAVSDIVDYSKVQIDDFGAVEVTRRNKARKNTYPVQIDNRDLPRIRALRERISGVPCVFWGAELDDLRSALLAYGLSGRFPLEIRGRTHSTYTLEVLGYA